MEKDFYYTELFEFYQGLLTERQRELFSSHYLYDLSLNEIAEPLKMTKQSVYDAIKKVKEKLDNFENTLHLKEKDDMLKELSDSITDKEIKEKIVKITEI